MGRDYVEMMHPPPRGNNVIQPIRNLDSDSTRVQFDQVIKTRSPAGSRVPTGTPYMLERVGWKLRVGTGTTIKPLR